MRKFSFPSIDYRRLAWELPLFLAAGLMSWFFHWEVDNLVFFCLFLWIILHPVSSRLVAASALIFLVLTAIWTVFQKEDWAEKLAIWAYYCLIFTLVMSWGELKKEAGVEKAD